MGCGAKLNHMYEDEHVLATPQFFRHHINLFSAIYLEKLWTRFDNLLIKVRFYISWCRY